MQVYFILSENIPMSRSQNNYPIGAKTIKYPRNIKILVLSRKITERLKIQGALPHMQAVTDSQFFYKKICLKLYIHKININFELSKKIK